MRLQGENQLINTMFQTITALQMKLKLRQTMLCILTHGLNILAMNCEKYVALLFNLIQDFENKFQDFWENNQYFAVFATPFSVNINMSPASFQMECIELQSGSPFKENFDLVSLLDFYRSCLPRARYPLLQSHLIHVVAIWQHLHL